MKKYLLSFVFVTSLLITNLFAQAEISSRLSDALAEASQSNAAVRALVVLNDQVDIQSLDKQLYETEATLEERAYVVITTLQDKANSTQGALLEYLGGKYEDEVIQYKNFWITNMVMVKAIPSVILEIADRNDVSYLDIDAELEWDKPVSSELATAKVPNGIEPGLAAINAPAMWALGFTGAGRVVMNDDTGVDGNHPAIGPRWRGNQSGVLWNHAWFDPETSTQFPTDPNSHGTHTMGTMCGLDPATNDTVGVAPGAQWIASKTINSPHTANSIAAWQWAVDPDGNPGTIDDMPDAIGNSWWDPNVPAATQCDPAINPYINAHLGVEASGIAIIFSAGNSGPSSTSITSPKNVNIDEVTFWATGSVNGNVAGYPISSFSSRGPVVAACSTGVPSLDIKPEASAPGESVRSSVPGATYGLKSGTSMAAPHVVGAIALLREAHPGITGKEAKLALYNTAVDLGDPGEDNTYGMGIIDVYAAYVSLADPTDPNPPSGFTAYSDYNTPTSMLLNWTDPTTYFNGNPLTNFQIYVYRDGAQVGTAAMGAETYTDMGLTDGQSYAYTIYAADIPNDSLSTPVAASWIAGGSQVPNEPTAFSVTNATAGDLNANWTNPLTQTDGTPLDDYAGVYLYENGTLLATFSRTVGDTGVVDTDVFTPTTTNAEYWVTAFDNETPINESVASNSAFPPYAAPYLEDFENAVVGTPGTLPVQWTNETDDDFDWWVDEDGTVSSATGPTVDHTLGTAAGNYMFTESSTPNFPSMVAHLTTPTIDISTLPSPGLAFWYHMHGATMGELHVDVFHNGTWNLDAMPALIGQQQAAQTDPWLQAIVDLSAYTTTPIQVRFRGITGTSFTSDMAIDDVHFTSLSGNPTMVVAPQVLGDTLLIGATSTVQFDISNTQASPTTLNFTVAEDPAVSWLSVLPVSGAITSSNTTNIDVSLDATGLTAGSYTIDLIVAGSDTNNTEDTVVVTLQVNEPPTIALNPTSFSKSLSTNQTTTDTLTISNTGLGVLDFELVIEDVTLVEILDTGSSGNNVTVKAGVTDMEMDKVGASLEGVLINNIPEGYSKYLNRSESVVPDLMHYKFDETGQTTTQNYAPAATRVNDFATLMGGMTMGSSGQTGAALIGTGGSSTSDYVDTGWGPDIGTGDWAISLWLNNMDMSTTLYYHFGDINTSSFRCFSGGVAGAGNLMLRGPVADVLVTGVGPGPAVVDFIYDSTVPEVRAYIDGVLNNAVPQTGVDITGSGPFKIGGYSSSLGLAAGELLDDFKMWNTIPTQLTWLIPDTLSGSIAAGSSMDIILTFDATGLIGGDYTSNVVVTSNDPANPQVSASAHLHVTGVADIGVSPSPMDWGTIFTNVNDTMYLTLENTGTDTLHVSSITNTDPEFTIAGNTAFSLLIGETYDLPVIFSSATPGTYNDSLVIVSNSANNPSLSVGLDGIAIDPPIVGVDPLAVTDSLLSGQSSIHYFDVFNDGASPLYFDIQVEDVTVESIVINKKSKKTAENVQQVPLTLPILSKGASVYVEQSPNEKPRVNLTPSTEAIWDLQFAYDVDTPSGLTGIAGAETDGSFLYSTKWSGTGEIVKLDLAGTYIETFTIPGVVNLRDLAYDGQYFYGSDAGSYIYQLDFDNRVLVSTITTPASVRAIAYDSDLDGFWYNNFSTDLHFVDRTGTLLSTITAPPSMYGCAYDNLSAGGPYLWIFTGTTTGLGCQVEQYDLATQTLTGVTHSVSGDLGAYIAGGLFLQPNLVAGTYTLGGLAQGTPDLIFGYELGEAGANWVSTNPVADTVAVGDTVQVAVTFDAAGLIGGLYEADIHVNSNDPVTPTVTVDASLHVTGVANIAVNPDMLDFGFLFLGAADTMTFAVENPGTADLNVSAMATSTPEFTVLTATPFTVTPGGSYDVDVVYSAATSGVHTDSVVVTHDAPVGTDVVQLTGETANPPAIALSDTLLQSQISAGQEDSTTLTIYNNGASTLDYELMLGDNPFSDAASYAGQPVDPNAGYNNKAEMGPAVDPGLTYGVPREAIWDLQFSYDVDTPSGLTGIAGAETDGVFLYGTKWSGTGEIVKFDLAGTYIETFSIPGVVNLRDLAYDGTYFYGSDAGSYIYQMDFDNRVLIATITTPASVRAIAYDSDLDGFWYNNFSTDLHFVDRSGTLISTITAPPSMYGCAYDNFSAGGPYLWIFTGTTTGGGCQVEQYDLATQTLTGVTHSVSGDLGAYIAGGLFLEPNLVSGTVTLGGMAQGTPDLVFGYEITEYSNWVSLDHTMGSVAPGDSGLVWVYWHGVDTEALNEGYLGVYSNDPVNPVENVHLILDVLTGIDDGLAILPTKYALHQNFPNPFNPSTTIKYDLRTKTDVTLTIFNVLGQKVRTLVNTSQVAGYQKVVWDGLNEYGEQVSTGIYIYRIEAGDFVKSRKMVFMK